MCILNWNWFKCIESVRVFRTYTGIHIDIWRMTQTDCAYSYDTTMQQISWCCGTLFSVHAYRLFKCIIWCVFRQPVEIFSTNLYKCTETNVRKSHSLMTPRHRNTANIFILVKMFCPTLTYIMIYTHSLSNGQILNQTVWLQSIDAEKKAHFY